MEGRRLTDGGFVFGMIVQHEQQHVETMLATHQLRAGVAVLDAPPPPPSTVDPSTLPATVLVPAGPFEMGTSIEPWALDNERPAHRVDLPAFRIDTFPVSNADYAAFAEAGGYDDPRWWTAAGWDHRQRAGLTAPAGWTRDGERWWRRRFGRDEPVPANEPVQHVTWFEADAYARWSGARLPTEAEWEKAARWDPATGRSRRYPWGDDGPTPERANLGGAHLGPAERGAYPAGASPLGVHQLVGDVWEWCAGAFRGYPGFQPYPYREYSEVFFGDGYRMLRGGSWATDAAACRGTFRNWDLPIRRQIFTGFRCARDVGPDDVQAPGLPRTPDAAADARLSTRRTRCCASPGRRATSGTAWSTPTASASAGTRPVTRCRSATAATVRSGPTRRSSTWPGGELRRGARRGPVGHPGHGRRARRRRRRSPTARWLFSHNGAVTGWPTSIARITLQVSPVELLALEARVRLGAALGAGPCTAAAGRRAARRRRSADAVRRRRVHRRRPAQPAAHRRPRDRGHRLGRLAVLAGRPRTASWSPPSRTTTSPAGRAVPDRSLLVASPRRGRHDPAPARRTPGGSVDPLTESLTLQSHLPAGLLAEALRADVTGGPDRDAEVAAAEVVLRRRAAASCSRRSPGCRSTTRPGPSGRSSPPRAAEIATPPAPAPWSSSAPARRRRPGCCSTRCGPAARWRRYVPVDVSDVALLASGRALVARLPRAVGARRARRLRARTSTVLPHRRPPADRLPRRHDRQPRARPSGRRSWPTCARALRARDALLLGTDLVKDPAVLVRRLRRRAGVTARSTRTCSR